MKKTTKDLIDPKKFKGSGLINRLPRSTDFLFGSADSPVVKVVLDAMRDWTNYLPMLELQYSKKGWDTMACVIFSALNCLETILNFLIANKKISQASIDWLAENGFISADGKVNFSDRMVAKMSGTTKNGNFLANVGDWIRKGGLVPEALWPFDRDNMTWDDYYSEIPQELKDMGVGLMLKWIVKYELVFPPRSEQFWNALQYGPVQTTVKYNSPIVNGVYQIHGGDTDHAVMMYTGKYGEYFDIFDHYDKSLKRYAWDYDFGMSLLYTMGEAKPLFSKLETQKDIVDYYIRKGIVLGVNEANFAKIEAGDKTLIDRIKNNHHSMFFRPEAHGEFYIINE